MARRRTSLLSSSLPEYFIVLKDWMKATVGQEVNDEPMHEIKAECIALKDKTKKGFGREVRDIALHETKQE
jgi:hypothetical protein